LQKKPAIKKALLLLREVQHSAKLYKFAQIASEIANKQKPRKYLIINTCISLSKRNT